MHQLHHGRGIGDMAIPAAAIPGYRLIVGLHLVDVLVCRGVVQNTTGSGVGDGLVAARPHPDEIVPALHPLHVTPPVLAGLSGLRSGEEGIARLKFGIGGVVELLDAIISPRSSRMTFLKPWLFLIFCVLALMSEFMASRIDPGR